MQIAEQQYEEARPQQGQEEAYEDYDDSEQGRYPALQEPMQGGTYANQDIGFLQWLFNFRKEAIIPLKHSWQGHEYDFQHQQWQANPNSTLRIMNENGITWGISLIESYLNPVYIVSDFDEKSYNFTMREAAHVIWNSLCVRYKEFGLEKTDIQRVAAEIESKIRAILLGAKDNGYRDFFSTQHQSVETKNLSQNVDSKKPGFFQSAAKMFRGMDNQEYQQ